MNQAIDLAAEAAAAGEVPVGAVVVVEGEVVAARRNEREATDDPAAHAELLALSDACKQSGDWRLPGATVVVTLEPCAMCAGALLASRIERVVFGAYDPKAGCCGSLYNMGSDPRLNHEFEVVSGVEEQRCGDLLRDFFKEHRTGPGPIRSFCFPKLSPNPLGSSTESCQSGRMGRTRNPLWPLGHRGFKSHTLRFDSAPAAPACGSRICFRRRRGRDRRTKRIRPP